MAYEGGGAAKGSFASMHVPALLTALRIARACITTTHPPPHPFSPLSPVHACRYCHLHRCCAAGWASRSRRCYCPPACSPPTSADTLCCPRATRTCSHSSSSTACRWGGVVGQLESWRQHVAHALLIRVVKCGCASLVACRIGARGGFHGWLHTCRGRCATAQWWHSRLEP